MVCVTVLVKLGLPLLQDLWIPYFTITTDITASAMRVHMDGECARSLLGWQVVNCDVRLQYQPLFLEYSSPWNLSFLSFLPSVFAPNCGGTQIKQGTELFGRN